MSEQELTKEQAEEAAELIQSVMPTIGLWASLLQDESLDLLKRSIRSIRQDQARKNAASVAYMAMGVDLRHNETFQNSIRNAGIIEKLIDLMEEVHRVQEEEGEFAKRKEQRESFLRSVGL